MKTILFFLALLCFCACQQEIISSVNDQFVGVYEGIYTEIYKYDVDYLEKDTIVLDTQQQAFLWEVIKAKGDTLLIDNKKITPFKDAFFKRLEIDHDPYGSFLIEDSQVWFFPEKDSFYMETLLPSDIVAGVTRVGAITSIGKRMK